MKKSWYRIAHDAAADPTVAEIHITDFIGSWDDDWIARNFGYDMGVTARAFLDTLAALPDAVTTLRVHINSPGGDVQAGINIANALRDQQASKGRSVTTFVDGIAASIASVIAMAGSRVVMADNALMMVHNPWSWAIGDAAEMRKVADILDAMRGQIVATYRWHSALDEADLVALMDAESWLTADEAITKGLATDKVEGLKAVASLSAAGAARLKVPEPYRAQVEALVAKPATATADPPATPEQVLAECDDLVLARALLHDKAPLAEVKTRVAAARATAAAEQARATQIRALCDKAKVPELASGYITGGMSADQVRGQLAIVTAKFDQIHIDGTLDPAAGGRRAVALSPAAVYAERNGTPSKE